MRSQKQLRRLVHRLHVKLLTQLPGVTHHKGIYVLIDKQLVMIRLPLCAKACMKAFRHLLGAHNHDILRQQACRRTHQISTGNASVRSKGHRLRQSMYPGISAPAACGYYRLAAQHSQCFFQNILHRLHVFLLLKAVISTAVIGYNQLYCTHTFPQRNTARPTANIIIKAKAR